MVFFAIKFSNHWRLSDFLCEGTETLWTVPKSWIRIVQPYDIALNLRQVSHSFLVSTEEEKTRLEVPGVKTHVVFTFCVSKSLLQPSWLVINHPSTKQKIWKLTNSREIIKIIRNPNKCWTLSVEARARTSINGDFLKRGAKCFIFKSLLIKYIRDEKINEMKSN